MQNHDQTIMNLIMTINSCNFSDLGDLGQGGLELRVGDQAQYGIQGHALA